ncbi:MAG TPA: HNH endonuclease [Acetobacteraceae bacterium]|nr:HNH endonuclease [Acetobacteraceae bacterium]
MPRRPDPKYLRIYDRFIAKRRDRPRPSGITHKHHILPRSLGGGDEPENLVVLKLDEHYFAHLLLAKGCGGMQWVPVIRLASLFVGFEYSRIRRLFMLHQNEASFALSGANNPTADLTTYDYVHEAGITRRCTRHELVVEFGLMPSDMSGIHSPSSPGKSRKGWTTREKFEALGFYWGKAGGEYHPAFDPVIYDWVHESGATERATRQHMIQKYNLEPNSVYCVLSGGLIKTAGGWTTAERAAQPGFFFGRRKGDNHPNADPTVRHWRHKERGDFVGTVGDLLEKQGLTSSSARKLANRVVNGKIKTVEGWWLVEHFGQDGPDKSAYNSKRSEIITLKRVSGETVTGTRGELMKKLRISPAMMNLLCAGTVASASGWTLPDTDPMRTRGTGRPRAPKKVSPYTKVARRPDGRSEKQAARDERVRGTKRSPTACQAITAGTQAAADRKRAERYASMSPAEIERAERFRMYGVKARARKKAQGTLAL